MSGGIFWVNGDGLTFFMCWWGWMGGRWRYILGDSEWVDIFYGWVGMSGCGGDIFCLGEGGLTFFMGG